MISKTQISKRVKRKTNPKLAETIELAKKKNLLYLAKKLSGPTRKQVKINLEDLDRLLEKDGDKKDIKEGKFLVVGKVLGKGELNKKIKIAALGFSEQAKEKLEKAGCEMLTIKQAIEKNPKLEGVKILN